MLRKFQETLLPILVSALLTPAPPALSQTAWETHNNALGLEPPPLNEITLGQRLHWATLQLIAPELLDTIVPVYIYPAPAITDQDITQTCLHADAHSSQSPCVYGALVQQGESNHLLWLTQETIPENPDDRLALNHQIHETPPSDIFWMNHGDWSHALESLQNQQMIPNNSSGESTFHSGQLMEIPPGGPEVTDW